MGPIISIHSFRGGTGKSNIAANLAYCCAAKGVRVGIVDTDIQSPGIHIIFGLKESSMKKYLNDYLKGDCSINDATQDVSARLDLPCGIINLIPSRLNAEEIVRMLKEGFDVSRLSRGFSELMKNLQLNLVLIDTHPGIEEETLLSLALSDMLLVILRPDEQDYLGTAITLEISKQMDVSQTLLIANRVPQEIDSESFKKNLEETYKCPVVGVLPFSYNFMVAQSKQVHCYASPNDPFSIEMKRIAERILSNKAFNDGFNKPDP